MATSPNVVNYSVLKGIAVFDSVDLGNVTEIEITPDFGKLDHNTQRAGVKSVDKTVVISKKVNIRLVMDEWSEANVRLAVLAAATGTPINLFSQSEREGDLVITGTNEVGIPYLWTFPSVSFLPSSSLNLISDEWGTMEISGTINAIAGVFGTVAAVT
jgi:hypothetical protein